jgi:hypothetical protein
VHFAAFQCILAGILKKLENLSANIYVFFLASLCIERVPFLGKILVYAMNECLLGVSSNRGTNIENLQSSSTKRALSAGKRALSAGRGCAPLAPLDLPMHVIESLKDTRLFPYGDKNHCKVSKRQAL